MQKILIIEDEKPIRENFAEIFYESGYEVFEASCGREGVEMAKSVKPDLIVCDISMPDMDGYEVKQLTGRDKSTSAIPFIYLTARTSISDFQHAMELGADDYITKPVRAAKLLELVSTRLERIAA